MLSPRWCHPGQWDSQLSSHLVLSQGECWPFTVWCIAAVREYGMAGTSVLGCPVCDRVPTAPVPGSSFSTQKWVCPTGPGWARAAQGCSAQEVINSITVARPWGRNEDHRAGSVTQAGSSECGWAGLLCSALLHTFSASLVLQEQLLRDLTPPYFAPPVSSQPQGLLGLEQERGYLASPAHLPTWQSQAPTSETAGAAE